MRKAVAVPYVIALILGVAVIALIGIWFVTSGGKFTKESISTECRSKAVEFCTRYPTGGVSEWGIVKGAPLSCDLTSLGIKSPSGDYPDCSKVLT